jgi:hypothetical protein
VVCLPWPSLHSFAGSRADARFLNPNSRSGDRHFNPAPAQYRHGAGEAQA